MNLQLSLIGKWFEMTKVGTKKEDYREITPYWASRLINKEFACNSHTVEDIKTHLFACPNGVFKKFNHNTVTLGYPKKGDTERILKLEHAGIEIREGNTDWGAEAGKIYFVIKHGKKL